MQAPDISTADLYKYYTNRLARRARQAAIIADQAVQEPRGASSKSSSKISFCCTLLPSQHDQRPSYGQRL